MKRLLLILPFFLVLASCGGGGSSSSSAPTTTTSVVADKESIEITTYNYSPDQSFESINIIASNVPAAGVYIGVSMDEENTSIESVGFTQSANGGVINIQFAPGDTLGEGTHLNKVGLAMCLDSQCNTHVEGSPLIINTTLTAEVGTASVATSSGLISVAGNSAEDTTPESSIAPITVTGIDPSALTIQVTEQQDEVDISNVSYDISDNSLELIVDYTDSSSLAHGNHTSSYSVDICYDDACNYPLTGSPLTLSVSYDLSSLPSGVGFILPDVRTELDHDIIDAEYSSQLNAVAIASSTPRNAVYIYSLDDPTAVDEISLDLIPTAISVANAGDSKKIAVGHDAKVTVIDFNKSNPVASAKTILDVPIDVYDLSATESAVYAVPKAGQWVELHRIDIANNSTSQNSGSSIYESSKIKLHPDLQSAYLANRGLSPSDIEKIDIQTVPTTYVADSPYHGDYHMCGDLWMSNSGNRIYTACGNTFKSSDVESQDMIYTGRLPLLLANTDSYDSYKLSSVSESNSSNEVAAIESESDFSCNFVDDACSHVLSFFTKDFLTRVSAAAFGDVSVAGGLYSEKPSFVFYNDDGSSVFVITQLLGIPTQKSYILEFNR